MLQIVQGVSLKCFFKLALYLGGIYFEKITPPFRRKIKILTSTGNFSSSRLSDIFNQNIHKFPGLNQQKNMKLFKSFYRANIAIKVPSPRGGGNYF